MLEYKDQKLVQYLQFGFPLSISQPELLVNQKVTNHFLPLQFQEAVRLYLAKEHSHGAILGPIKNFSHHPGHNFVHYSPILTRPKGFNKRHVILDLSSFLSIDDIVKEICSHGNDVVISKIDVARAFRNLCVDPANAVKLGIRWGDDAYIDVAVTFGLVHGSAVFQRISDTVTFIMAQEGIKMFAYIDDYIPGLLLTLKSNTWCHFWLSWGCPATLINNPPCRKLTCLGIQIDLDNCI